MTLLVVTAVPAEAEAIQRGLAGSPAQGKVTVAPVGAGMAAAAAGTARLLTLADSRYRAVVSAGIAGGIGVPIGATVLATRCVAADLGAQAPAGYLSLEELGFGSTRYKPDQLLLTELRGVLPEAVTGEVLTVATVTGTSDRAAELAARHPEAVAEAMEGCGVACAAQLAGIPFGELRTISNAVGPRDRAAWRIGDALAALTVAASAFATL